MPGLELYECGHVYDKYCGLLVDPDVVPDSGVYLFVFTQRLIRVIIMLHSTVNRIFLIAYKY